MINSSRSETRRTGRAAAWQVARSGLLAVAVFCLLQWTWMQARDTMIERVVVHHLTVDAACAMINWITPHVHARAVGASIQATGGGLDIRSGCEGTEVLFLLAAALVVGSGTARSRWGGLMAGTAVVFSLNQLRVLALFYSYRHDPALFAQLHTLVAPLAMVAGTLLFYVAWIEGMQWRYRGATPNEATNSAAA